MKTRLWIASGFVCVAAALTAQAQDLAPLAAMPLPPEPPQAPAAAPVAPVSPAPPVPARAPIARAGRSDRDREESLYRDGMRAIDKREYERALEQFDRVYEQKASRADGALYWKAYAQNRLGRRDQALATLAQLQKEYPQSRWLNDARALEVEVKQASGNPVSPDAESDEDLKLLAINGLMSSDPERAVPLLEKVLNDPKASPRVRERAMFVVAQSRDAKARDILVRLAKGGGNPDLQIKAVEFLGVFSGGNTQALADVYASTSDAAVKRAVIHGLMIANDSGRLLSLAKSERSSDLRAEAVRMLGVMKRQQTSDALIAMYSTETDKTVRGAILDGLFIQQNAKALVDIARKETDPQLKRQVVEKLSVMRSKEATDFMLEVLNK